MKAILDKDNKILRQNAKAIELEEIQSAKIKKILKEMSVSLKGQGDGVAIAAPQIGYGLRIFVVSGKIFEPDFLQNREERLSGEKDIDDVIKTKVKLKDLVFINPKITKLSREKEWVPEGCLSVRWLYGKTHRSKKCTVEAYDQEGNKFKMGASGLLSQIFQHETDHLNGVLFIDHAKDLKEEPPQ